MTSFRKCSKYQFVKWVLKLHLNQSQEVSDSDLGVNQELPLGRPACILEMGQRMRFAIKLVPAPPALQSGISRLAHALSQSQKVSDSEFAESTRSFLWGDLLVSVRWGSRCGLPSSWTRHFPGPPSQISRLAHALSQSQRFLTQTWESSRSSLWWGLLVSRRWQWMPFPISVQSWQTGVPLRHGHAASLVWEFPL